MSFCHKKLANTKEPSLCVHKRTVPLCSQKNLPLCSCRNMLLFPGNNLLNLPKALLGQIIAVERYETKQQ
jgi:hypothetical protein